MNRDQAREKFAVAGLTYTDIGSKEIAMLRQCIEQELETFQNDSFRMKLIPTLKKYANYGKEGGVETYCFRVKGWVIGEKPYFTDREAITFNPEEFIGFCGWADSINVQPFLSAFCKWVDLISVKLLQP